MLKFILLFGNAICTFSPNDKTANKEEHVLKEFANQKRKEYPLEKIYIPNPRLLFDEKYHSDEKIVFNNMKWLEEIHYSAGQSGFIKKMINLPNTVPFIPFFGATQVDPAPVCWVLLAYNSDTETNRELTFDLLEGLTKFYHERCGISSVDIGYPTNYAIFKNLLEGQELPLIIVKKPIKAHKMFIPESLKIRPTGRAEGNFKLSPIENWGKMFTKKDLAENPNETFEEINKIYEESSENVKMSAMLMEHYHELDKGALELLMKDMMIQVRNHTAKIVTEQGYMASIYRPDFKNMTEIQIEKHDLEYASKFSEEMEKVYKDEKTISFRFLINESLKLALHTNPTIFARFNLDPIKQPVVDACFKSWIHTEF